MEFDPKALFDYPTVSICPACNRPLKHPKSIERGIGPVCERKQKDKEANEQLHEVLTD